MATNNPTTAPSPEERWANPPDPGKVIRFETTLHKELMGCRSPQNAHKLIVVEVPLPKDMEDANMLDLTSYVEELTGFIAIGFLHIIPKPIR